MRIGLLAGVQEELDAFVPNRARRQAAESGFVVNTIEHSSGHTVLACMCGIGKVNAASAASMLVARYEVDLLAIIGTAGNIGRLSPGPYVLAEAVQSDFGAWRSDGFAHYRAGTWPIGKPDQTPFRSTLAARLALNGNYSTTRIATGDCFVEDADHGARLALNLGAGLVDMETAALAQVAERAEVDWVGVKAVSDDADGDGADSFMANLRAAAAEAAGVFDEILSQMPAG